MCSRGLYLPLSLGTQYRSFLEGLGEARDYIWPQAAESRRFRPISHAQTVSRSVGDEQRIVCFCFVS